MDFSSTIFQSDPKVAYRLVDGKAVLVHPIENRIVTLNEIASAIWIRLDGRTMKDISSEIQTHFDVDRETLKVDIESFMVTMENRGFVIRTTPE